MYDEVDYKVDWVDKFKKAILIFIVMFIIAFVILLIIRKPQEEQSNFFDYNLNTMMSVAKNYYSQNDTNKKITLKEMVKKKMMLDLTDEEGNLCDYNNSYAIRNNQNIKVYLKCANEEKETDDNII